MIIFPRLLSPIELLTLSTTWTTVLGSNVLPAYKNVFFEMKESTTIFNKIVASECYRIYCYHPETFLVAVASNRDEIIRDWNLIQQMIYPTVFYDSHNITYDALIQLFTPFVDEEGQNFQQILEEEEEEEPQAPSRSLSSSLRTSDSGKFKKPQHPFRSDGSAPSIHHHLPRDSEAIFHRPSAPARLNPRQSSFESTTVYSSTVTTFSDGDESMSDDTITRSHLYPSFDRHGHYETSTSTADIEQEKAEEDEMSAAANHLHQRKSVSFATVTPMFRIQTHQIAEEITDNGSTDH